MAEGRAYALAGLKLLQADLERFRHGQDVFPFPQVSLSSFQKAFEAFESKVLADAFPDQSLGWDGAPFVDIEGDLEMTEPIDEVYSVDGNEDSRETYSYDNNEDISDAFGEEIELWPSYPLSDLNVSGPDRPSAHENINLELDIELHSDPGIFEEALNSVYSSDWDLSKRYDCKLLQGFQDASRSIHQKLLRAAEDPSTMPNEWSRDYIKRHLRDEQEIVSRGMQRFKDLLNHDTSSFTRTKDFYTVLHVAYAMANTEGGVPYVMTPAKFQDSIDVMRGCLRENTARYGSEPTSSCEVFDDLVAVLWDEFKIATSWLGEQDAKFFQTLHSTTEKLETIKVSLNRRAKVLSTSPGMDTNRSHWVEMARGSIFVLVLGFMHVVNGKCHDVFQTFKNTAYSFLLQPFLPDHEVIGVAAYGVFLQLSCQLFAKVVKRYLGATIRASIREQVVKSMFLLVKEGIIPTVRHFENYIVWIAKMTIETEADFVNFVDNVLTQCRHCAAELECRGMECKEKPTWAEEYTDEYVLRRLVEETNWYRMKDMKNDLNEMSGLRASISIEGTTSGMSTTTPPSVTPDSLSPASATASTSSRTSVATSGSPPGREGAAIPCRKGCGKLFPRAHNRYRHEEKSCPLRERSGRKYYCGIGSCLITSTREDNIHRHRRKRHGFTENLLVKSTEDHSISFFNAA